jgi:hypothetical protein
MAEALFIASIPFWNYGDSVDEIFASAGFDPFVIRSAFLRGAELIDKLRQNVNFGEDTTRDC